MQTFIDKAWEFLVNYGPAVLWAGLTLLAGWFASKIATGITRRMLTKAKIDATLTGFISHIAYALLMTITVISAIEQLGIPTAPFVAVLGAAGLAVGFALQNSLSNFASGVLLILFRPFKVGDYIEAGGIGGTVEEIQIFATHFCSPDNKKIIVPNSEITSSTITNYSANATRRVEIVVGIGYQDDIEKAKQVIEGLFEADERVLKDPKPFVAVSELADNSVNLLVRPWAKREDFWSLKCDLTERIKNAFDEHNISIPYPQRDVHIHQAA